MESLPSPSLTFFTQVLVRDHSHAMVGDTVIVGVFSPSITRGSDETLQHSQTNLEKPCVEFLTIRGAMEQCLHEWVPVLFVSCTSISLSIMQVCEDAHVQRVHNHRHAYHQFTPFNCQLPVCSSDVQRGQAMHQEAGRTDANEGARLEEAIPRHCSFSFGEAKKKKKKTQKQQSNMEKCNLKV